MRIFNYKLHKNGFIFVILSFISVLLSKGVCFLISVSILIFMLYFFRDPKRSIPNIKNAIVSPCDGIVKSISEVNCPDFFAKVLENENCNVSDINYTRISIFLNIFDVHVNRIPVDGKIKKIHYKKGKFSNVMHEKSRDCNESNFIAIENDLMKIVLCNQIAGLLARRIVCDVRKGDNIALGDKYGIILFGSRVDLYLPMDQSCIALKIGQRVTGGETIIYQKLNGEAFSIHQNKTKKEDSQKKIEKKLTLNEYHNVSQEDASTTIKNDNTNKNNNADNDELSEKKLPNKLNDKEIVEDKPTSNN